MSTKKTLHDILGNDAHFMLDPNSLYYVYGVLLSKASDQVILMLRRKDNEDILFAEYDTVLVFPKCLAV